MHNWEQFAPRYDVEREMMRARTPRFIRNSGLGCGAVLAIVLLVYIVSVLWWSIWLTVGVRASGAEPWSYWHVVTHWGLLIPLVLG